jgi:TrmH family RNA methyltransferase
MSTTPLKRISGRDNPEFKRFLAVSSRKEKKWILAEGPKLVAEAARSKLPIEVVAFVDHAGRGEAHPDAVPARRLVQFSAALMKSLSDVEAPQGVLALVERPRFADDWLRRKDAFILVLDRLQDPGNVGTLLRTAEAASVSGVLLTRGCADPLSPKALRASAGSAFRLPHLADLSVSDVLERLQPSGASLLAAVAGPGAVSIFAQARWSLPLALALGSEGSGLDPRFERAATHLVRVPSARPVESLNVAAAGAIAMFEIARRASILPG